MNVSNHLKLVSAVALSLAAFVTNAQDSGRTVTPSEVQWNPSPAVKGVENAYILGDAKKPGPYVQRVKFPANFTIQPHTHPDDRTYTIISGTWYVGWGEKLDETKLKALPPGSFYTEPANVPHFVVTKGEPVIVQITGATPSGLKYVDPAHAPKK